MISKYFGAQDEEKLRCAVHTNFLLGIVFSVFATLIGLFLFRSSRLAQHAGQRDGGGETVLRNLFCRCLHRHHVQYLHEHHEGSGDSVHPLYYLIFSSIVNMIPGSDLCGGISVECRRRCCCHGDRPGIECFIMHDPHGEGWRGCDDPF